MLAWKANALPLGDSRSMLAIIPLLNPLGRQLNWFCIQIRLTVNMTGRQNLVEIIHHKVAQPKDRSVLLYQNFHCERKNYHIWLVSMAQ